MSDTMIAMEFVYADLLTPAQLMQGDLVNIDNNIVEVLSVVDDATGDNYNIETQNEFGEKEVTQYSYTDLIPLYVFIQHD